MNSEASDRSHRVYDVVFGRRVTWRVCLVSLFVLGVVGFAAPSALALSQRGHEYGFSFGSTGEPGTTLSDPGAVAVSEVGPSAGDVYVLDRGHNRIVRYGPHGEFVSAWGWGVGSKQKKYEVCTSECHAGFAGAGKDELNGDASVAIAVDNSSGPSAGDVYVATEGRRDNEGGYEQIDKFTGSGEPVEAITEVKYLESEPTGTKKKERKEEEEALTDTEELKAEETHGLTVGPDGTVWLYYEEALYGLSGAKLSEDTFAQKPLEFTLSGEPAPGLAVDARGAFYLAWRPAGEAGAPGLISRWEMLPSETVEGLEFGEALEALDREDSTAVATDQTGVPGHEAYGRDDVYLANVNTSQGGQTTSVAQFSPGGSPIQRFTAPAQGLREGAGIAVDGKTGDVYVADAAATANDIAVFTPEKAGPPTIEGESLSARDVSTETVGERSGEEVDVRARLDATIDPRGATEKTAYRFEYGTAPCAGGGCASVPGGQLGGQGFADEGFGEQDVSVALGTGTASPLAPGVIYRYRVVAENEHGQSVSAEGAFSTPPAKGPFIADERGWELVSPPGQEGADADPLGMELPGPIQAAAGGDALAYTANAPFCQPEGNRSIEVTEILSVRGREGWNCQDIVTPSGSGEGIKTTGPSEYKLFSPDLALALLVPFQGGGQLAEPPLAPPASEAEKQLKREQERKKEALDYAEKTVYERADAPLGARGEEVALYAKARENGETMEDEAAELGQHAAYPGYLALVTGLDAPGAQFGGESLRFAAATPELSHVALESVAPLLPGEAENGLYEWSAGPGGEGRIAPVNTLQDTSEPATFLSESYLGGLTSGGITGARSLSHAISENGSRLFFTSKPHLYMRDMSRAETLQLDRVGPGAAGEGPGREYPDNPVFQTANAEGSRVFFTDEERLTADSGAAKEQPDLYVCEIAENETTHKLECGLRDLTPKSPSGESADVQDGGENPADVGGVLGAGEDEGGATVYLVADGVLCERENAKHECEAENAQGEKAVPGHCGLKGYPQATCNLYVERYDAQAGKWEAPRLLAVLSAEDEPDWAAEGQGRLTARVSPDGRYLAFMSDRALTSFAGQRYSTAATAPGANGASAEEVYEYDSQTGRIVCASCEPSGARPAGVLDPSRATSAASLLVDESGTWQGRWLAGSLPQWPGIDTYGAQADYENRVLSDSGRLYFESPEALVGQDRNGLEDVYEYEPEGVPQGRHECRSQSATFSQRSSGCVGLISSGTSSSESAFLDASVSGGEGPEGEELSEGGGDVFFLTAQPLSPRDAEETFHAYDAHECTRAEECHPETQAPAAQQCGSGEECHPFAYSAPTGEQPAGPAGQGNVNSHQKVLATQVKAKPPTRAQKLAKALASCRKRYKHAKTKRLACEKQAHKRYGPLVKKKRAKR